MEDVPTLLLSKEQNADDVVIYAELNEQKRAEIKGLINEYGVIFSELPGKTNVIICNPRCSSNQPVHVRQYPLPFAVHEDTEK